jgi:hypothetical protein
MALETSSSAGRGAITDPDIFDAATTTQNQDCKEAVNEANDDTTDLTIMLSVISPTAVKTHFTRTLNRVPGVDFRCPTPAELDALAAFQEYLGRRFELALKQGVPTDADDGINTSTNFASGTQVDASQPVVTFNDATAETGKTIFRDGNAQCNLCHFNAGADDGTDLVHAPNVNDPSAPFSGPQLCLEAAGRYSALRGYRRLSHQVHEWLNSHRAWAQHHGRADHLPSGSGRQRCQWRHRDFARG